VPSCRNPSFPCDSETTTRISSLFSNSSSPRAGLLTPILDKLFESFEIAFHPTRYYPERVTGFFDETFWIIQELKADVRPVFIDKRKVYCTGRIFASFALPGNQLVRNLIGDSSIPLFIFTRYPRLPSAVSDR
jgi:hypothetical protein